MTGEKVMDARALWLPISAVVTILGAVIGMMLWMTNLYSTLQIHTEQIGEIRSSVNTMVGERSDYIGRISKLEAKIDILLSR